MDENEKLSGHKAEERLNWAVQQGYQWEFEGSVLIHIRPSDKKIYVMSNNPLDILKRSDMQQKIVDAGLSVHDVNKVLNEIQAAVALKVRPDNA